MRAAPVRCCAHQPWAGDPAAPLNASPPPVTCPVPALGGDPPPRVCLGPSLNSGGPQRTSVTPLDIRHLLCPDGPQSFTCFAECSPGLNPQQTHTCRGFLLPRGTRASAVPAPAFSVSALWRPRGYTEPQRMPGRSSQFRLLPWTQWGLVPPHLHVLLMGMVPGLCPLDPYLEIFFQLSLKL